MTVTRTEPGPSRRITREDILSLEDYAVIRKQKRADMTARKRNRRMEVGPYATFYFECYDTMWHQIHEMLFIEKGGEDQIRDELEAYNPLIPDGRELVATLMFEIQEERRRKEILSRLGGVEEFVCLRIGARQVKAVPEADIDRTNAAGKASSVQFLHFPFTPDQIAAFRADGARVELCIEHPAYGHIAVMPEAVRLDLAGDFD